MGMELSGILNKNYRNAEKDTGEKFEARIDQLLNEKFEYETPEMLFEEEKITGKVRKGENFRSFLPWKIRLRKK